jgi:hypothetical protein
MGIKVLRACVVEQPPAATCWVLGCTRVMPAACTLAVMLHYRISIVDKWRDLRGVWWFETLGSVCCHNLLNFCRG